MLRRVILTVGRPKVPTSKHAVSNSVEHSVVTLLWRKTQKQKIIKNPRHTKC